MTAFAQEIPALSVLRNSIVVLGRKPELTRHVKTHAVDVEDLYVYKIILTTLCTYSCTHPLRKIPCPYEGCLYRTLQKSNLKTHITAVQ